MHDQMPRSETLQGAFSEDPLFWHRCGDKDAVHTPATRHHYEARGVEKEYFIDRDALNPKFGDNTNALYLLCSEFLKYDGWSFNQLRETDLWLSNFMLHKIVEKQYAEEQKAPYWGYYYNEETGTKHKRFTIPAARNGWVSFNTGKALLTLLTAHSIGVHDMRAVT